MEKVKIGISSCLLGKKVRYDGGHKLDRYITDTLGRYFDWVPVCPEVEYGLPVPREAMHLTGEPDSPHLLTIHSRVDHTEGMLKWSRKKLKELEKEKLCGFIFKSKSPSSGIREVKIYTPSGISRRTGAGIFGGAFMHYFPLVPVIDDSRLHNPGLRDNFIERVFVYKRWKELINKDRTIRDLITFHTEHKLLILSHSPKHYRALGQMVANVKKYKPEKFYLEYIKLLMEGLHLLATVKKNRNVLLHIIGYVKKLLSTDEKHELLEVIENYHKGYIPLIVPVVLINHYVRKFDTPYLKRQYYLNPNPVEFMIRNHV
jgi:uncharacterized protein YbgA (DUF1722 family)/uncharacterized protein YbbK (DUF523 family)